MATVTPERSSKTVAVTLLGLIALLMGGGYAVLGGELAGGGVMWFAHPDGDQMVPVITLGGFLVEIIIVIGVAFLLLGVLGILAGRGVLLRK